ncbi:GAF domain-containing protein [Streptomyces monashensis]|uniref:GAF domain-containing protein n=1 Tax=Streptomyces monashensis TaxID=1678012 RepID=UPI0033D68BB6
MPVAHRADQLTSCIALALDEPLVFMKLRDAAGELREAPDLAAALLPCVEEAMALTGGEFGNIQIVHPHNGSLVLVTQCGFGNEFLDHFALVNDSRSVCGRAAGGGAQAVVTDVRTDPALTPHQQVFRRAGVRSVQSTPLVDRTGRLIGMISTHTSQPGCPSDRDLRLLEFYAQLAGDVLAQHLSKPSANNDPVGPQQEASSCSPPPPDQEPTDSRITQILTDTTNRIFSAGISFAGALPLIDSELATQRVQDGINRLDETIRSIQRGALDQDTL